MHSGQPPGWATQVNVLHRERNTQTHCWSKKKQKVTNVKLTFVTFVTFHRAAADEATDRVLVGLIQPSARHTRS